MSRAVFIILSLALGITSVHLVMLEKRVNDAEKRIRKLEGRPVLRSHNPWYDLPREWEDE